MHEVDDIEPALAQFVLGDERLCAVQLVSYLGLRKPGALARFHQQLAQTEVLGLVEDCRHPESLKPRSE